MAVDVTLSGEPKVHNPALRGLHWTIALIVLAILPIGFVMLRLPSGPTQDRLFDLHRSLGVLILALMVLRLVVRSASAVPPPAPGPAWQQAGARIVHVALYVALLTMPFLGWASSSAFGAPVTVFGLFTLPSLVPKDDTLSDLFGSAHKIGALIVVALLVLHIGAGLWHGIVRRDGVLARMLPFLNDR